MRPHSLLFSSDEEASRALSHAFRDLEFEVETCPEIFSAVEKITTRSFDVVVSDWNEGLEAVFLLKTVRELKGNHSAFTLAIANAEAAGAAREAGADLVLSQPLVPDEVKYALLTCDSFLVQMKSWLTRMSSSPAKPIENRAGPETSGDSSSWAAESEISASEISEDEISENQAFNSVPRLRPWPSPPPQSHTECVSPVVAAESIFEDDLLYRSRVQTLFQAPQQTFSSSSSSILLKKGRSRVLPGLAIAVAFLSVGYVFNEPLRGEGTTNTVAKICGRVLERTQGWWHRPNGDETPAATVQVAEENGSPQFVRPGRAVGRITITPVRDPYQNDAVPTPAEPAQPVPAEIQPPRPQPVAASAIRRIPESLKSQVQSASMRSVAERITPSLLAALEPVALSEDLSRRLLLQKVLPNYPERAVRARLQGPVVLQAWIGRDGNIQDLKLVRGSLLLGEAAYRAVKQWRYQPYLINGRAVEAETFVTVDFRLP